MAEISFVEVIAVGPRWNKVLASDGRVYTLRGDYNWRSNNPGNIEYGPFAISQGAIGSGAIPPGRKRGFAIFPTREVGERARATLQFEKPSYKDKTIIDAISKYAPSADRNNPAAYAAAVAAAAGVAVSTKMSDLTPAQREKFFAAQSRVEGMRAGTIKAADGKPVPLAMAQQFSAKGSPPANVGPAPVPAARSIATRASQVITEPSGGMPPPPRRRPAVGTVLVPPLSKDVTPLTFERPSVAPAAKPPVAGLIKVVPGRAPAPMTKEQAQAGSGFRLPTDEYNGGVGGAGIAGQVPLPKGVVPKGAAAAMDQARAATTKPPVSGLIQLVDPAAKKSGLGSVPAGIPLNSGSRDSVANAAAGRAAAASATAKAAQKQAEAVAAQQRAAAAHQQRMRQEAVTRRNAAAAQAQKAAAAKAAVLAASRTTVVDKFRQQGMTPSQAYDTANRDSSGYSTSVTYAGTSDSGRRFNMDTSTWE